jgi:hypothetical protein
MTKRFDPVQYYDVRGSGYGDMKECTGGDYVRVEDYEKLQETVLKYQAALQLIAGYDKGSKFGEGICPYGCDCPNIAQEALK